jgi:hypothetical protein
MKRRVSQAVLLLPVHTSVMHRTFAALLVVLSVSGLAAARAAVGSSHFTIVIPKTMLTGGTASVPLAGPPSGPAILNTTWNLTYKAPHGGTPASELIFDLSLPAMGGPVHHVVTGAELGWPAAVGTFSGVLVSDALNGVVVDGSSGNSTAQLSIYGIKGGVTGQLFGSSIMLEMEEICQKDLGGAGPGHVQLSICGDVLGKGGHADLTVTGVPPSAPVLFLASLSSQPKPFKGGTLLPVPRLVAVAAKADASGGLHFVVPGGGVSVIFVLQLAAADPSQPQGVAMSNALVIELLH